MITYSFYADDDKRQYSYLIGVQDDICLEDSRHIEVKSYCEPESKSIFVYIYTYKFLTDKKIEIIKKLITTAWTYVYSMENKVMYRRAIELINQVSYYD